MDNIAPPPITSPTQPVPPPAPDPAPPYVPSRKPPLVPLLFGFLTIILVVGAIGLAYYQAKFAPSKDTAPSPTPYQETEPSPSLEPSPLATPSISPKPSITPVSVLPSITPSPQPTLDIRFANPSAYIKQTIDEGKGDGRVINREYSSIQSGQFDEIKSSYSPRITVCYNFIANQAVAGSSVKFRLTLNDQLRIENNLGQYDQMEAGKTYQWCHDLDNDLGSHTARLTLNPDKSLKESNYNNNLGRIDWQNLPDKIAPNFTLIGPTNEGSSGTCLSPQYIEDNVTPLASLKLEHKIDSGAWTTYTTDRYCFTGSSGSSHTYAYRVTDQRGNQNEQSKTFVLY